MGKIESTLFNAAQLIASANKIASGVSSQSSQASVVTNNARTRDFASLQTSAFSQTSNVRKTARISLGLQAFATELTAAVKKIAAFASLDSNFNQTAIATKVARITKELPSIVTVNVSAKKSVNSQSLLSCQASVVGNVFVGKVGEAHISAMAFEVIAAAKTANELADLRSTTTLTVSVGVTKRLSSTISSEFVQIAANDRLRSYAATATSAFVLTSDLSRVISAEVQITSAMQFTAGVREIHIEEIVYVISAEIWEYQIMSETREYTIKSDKKYIIT